MAHVRRDRPQPAPVPVSRQQTAAGPTVAATAPLGTLWERSWGKAVGEVTTVLGTLPQPTGTPSPDGLADLVARVDAVPVGSTAHLPVDAERRLAAAGAAAVLTRRSVAVDRYVLHRAYPSPRALFGVDLEHHRSDGRRSLLTPWAGAVLSVAEPAHGADTGPSRSQAGPGLVALARPERYPDPYGELRTTLTELEAGHLLATALAVAGHLDLEPVTVLGGPGDRVGRMSLRPGVPDGLELPVRAAGDLVAAATAGTSERTLAEWFAGRTSGPSDANLITSVEPTADVVARLDAVVSLGLAAVRSLCPPGALVVHRTTLHGRGMSDRTLALMGPDGAGRSAPLASRAPWSSALGYTWSIDPHAWEQEHGAVGDGAVQALLGWLCQWVCLAAADLGVAARPMRNIDEALWAHDLQLDDRAMPAYQVWIRPLTAHDRTPSAWTTQGRPA